MAEKPTSWPESFTFATVSPIADWLNEPIEAARRAYNVRLVNQGKPTLSGSQFDAVYLPIYPRDGWLRYGGGIPDFQIIGPGGVRGFGLHEFQGHPEITERINFCNWLMTQKQGGTVPSTPLPPGTPPPPPEPLPPGTPPLPPEGGIPLPPGTPDPSSPPMPRPMGNVLLLAKGRYEVTCRFPKDGTPTEARAVSLSDLSGYFTFFSDDNIEVVVKYADLSPIGLPRRFFLPAATDVKFKLTVLDKHTNQSRAFENIEGKLLCPILDF